MSDFTTSTSTDQVLDPYKRVKYSQGLVLGVEEFEQEQLYFLEKNRLHNRLLHGYGTASGLRVGTKGSGADLEVVVSCGVAVDPHGREIRVEKAQCAKLDAWLSRNKAALEERFGSPPDPLRIYVVLCYRDCETDLVPIAGGPCRTQEESMAASRIEDEFELKLSLDPPDQAEEDAVRRFGELLHRIEITSDAVGYIDQATLEDYVRGLIEGLASPIEDDGGPLYLRPEEACDALRGAFKVWVTEVRPNILPDGQGCCGGAPDEGCVLLAALEFDVDSGWKLTGEVEIQEENRPILLHTRLLQEWLMCGRQGYRAGVHTFATLFLESAFPPPEEGGEGGEVVEGTSVLRAWIHHPDLLDIPVESVGIKIDEGEFQNPASISRAVAGTNVYQIEVHAGIGSQTRVTVRFDASGISTMEGEEELGESLLVSLETLPYAYLDRDGEYLYAYLAQALDHGTLAGLEDDDHLQYLPVTGPRTGDPDLNMHGKRVVEVSPAQKKGDVLVFGQKAAGDLTGTYPSPVVQGIIGRPIKESGNGVTDGDVLVFRKAIAAWQNEPMSAGGATGPAGGDLSGNYPNPSVTGMLKLPLEKPTAIGQAPLFWAESWVPTGAVTYPAQPAALQQVYAIVAAGFFDGTGAARGPVFGELKASFLQTNIPNEYMLSFPNYAMPPKEGATWMYIVKGTVEDISTTTTELATLQLVAFDAEGIRIRIKRSRSNEVRPGFMVEISLYTQVTTREQEARTRKMLGIRSRNP